MHQKHNLDEKYTPAQVINVQAFLNQHPFSRFQTLIFAFCFFILLLDGFDTAAIGFIAPSLMAEWAISKQGLAPILSAALFGLAAGALISGPISDRIGRKLVLGFSVMLFGLACTFSSFAPNIEQLVMLRFITGLGLGAAMPNAVTLISEYCPDHRRSMITNAMYCGFPLGAAFGGFLAAWMIPQWGWRSVLLMGGVAPILLSALIFILLPESIRYMVATKQSQDKIRKILRKISTATADIFPFTAPEKIELINSKTGLALVLSRQYIVGSVMLWLTYFMGLVIFYSLINWMPVLFNDAGLAPKMGASIAALFPLGGVGAIFFGWLMDRYNANLIIATGYALTSICIYFIGQFTGNIGLLMLVVFLGGGLMNTAQSSMGSLAAAFYPTQARVTGVAWMLGIGRFGGIAGSFLVAELSRRHLSFDEIFMIVAIAGLIAAGALLIKQYFHLENK